MPKSKDESCRKYRDEPLARAAVLNALSSHFAFIEEVTAVDADGNTFKLDAVSRCLKTSWTFGWEFKRSSLYKSEFAGALRQTIQYRLSKIVDERLPKLQGQQLSAMALFPDWLGEHDDDGQTNYKREAEGMRLLAEKFRAGTMREVKDNRFSFIMGETAIWHSTTGWTKNAEGVLFGKRTVGATRKNDAGRDPRST